MKVRFVSLALLLGLVAAFAFSPMSSTAAPKPKPATDGFTTPVTGTVPGGTFTGTVTLLDFINKNGQLAVTGVLTGTTTIAGVVTQVTQTFTAPVTAAAGGSCDILFLDIGPIFLDLLGLQVDLSRIVLDIDAVAGAGNLLGNLLCAVVGILDGGLNLDILTNQLNVLLDVLAALQR
jgi:hypothetical protein